MASSISFQDDIAKTYTNDRTEKQSNSDWNPPPFDQIDINMDRQKIPRQDQLLLDVQLKPTEVILSWLKEKN